MKFLIGSAAFMAGGAMAQYISSPVVLTATPSLPPTVITFTPPPPVTVSVTPSSSAPAPTVPPPSSGSLQTLTYYDCTDTSSVTGTVTDLLTSTYCDKCHEVYTTIYPVTYVDVCPTGTTANVYTITETCTGNSASFTPTSCPAGFTTYTTECEVCQEKTLTVTAPVSTATATPTEAAPTEAAPTGAPPAGAPPAPPYTAPPPPKVKPAGTTVSYPPASTSGPQLVTVNAAAGSNVQLLSLAAGLVGAVFAGMVML